MSATNGYRSLAKSKHHVTRSIGKLTHDALELGEMQLQLLKLDSKKAVKRVRSAFVLAMIGLTLLLASTPIALLAIAELLIEHGEWSRADALGVAAVCTLGVSFVLAAIAWWRFRQSMGSWNNSNEEFNRNIAWLKSALRSQGEAEALGDNLPGQARQQGPQR